MEATNKSLEQEDFPKVTTSNGESENGEKTSEKVTNLVFSIMIFFTLVGMYLIVTEIEDYTKPLRELNTSYKFPHISDFYILLYLCPLVMVREKLNIN